LLVLFPVLEGRNGARSRESNELASRIAASATPALIERLARRHGLEPFHGGVVAVTGGSDDHGSFDIAATWTEARATTPQEFLREVSAGMCAPGGTHGSTPKLAHALTALIVNAYRAGGGELPEIIAARVERLFDSDADDAATRHEEIAEAMADLTRLLGERARAGGVQLSSLPALGGRLGAVAFAAALQAPYLATAHHHADSRQSLATIERGFFGVAVDEAPPRALVFTDTFTSRSRFRCRPTSSPASSVSAPMSSTSPLPAPSASAVSRSRGCFGIPVAGSYHTELGPYALDLTRDLLVAKATETYVEWFYRQ
jgi:hypothetical protein